MAYGINHSLTGHFLVSVPENPSIQDNTLLVSDNTFSLNKISNNQTIKMKIYIIATTAALLLLAEPLEVFGNACQKFYATGDPEITGQEPGTQPAQLECEDFAGDPGLHAVVYGCNSINQNVTELPARVIRLSFNRICRAQISEFATFTCYDMQNTTTFEAFEQEIVESGFTMCQEGDRHQQREYCIHYFSFEGIHDQSEN